MLDLILLLAVGINDVSKTKRILAVSSGGGHWVELRRLKPVFDQYETAYITTNADSGVDVPDNRLYVVTNFTRRNYFRVIFLVPELVVILLKEKPDVIISTGAAPGLVCLALAKMLTRARTIWIDSIAARDCLSTSGREARRFADVWLTQWPDLSGPDGPDCWGAVV